MPEQWEVSYLVYDYLLRSEFSESTAAFYKECTFLKTAQDVLVHSVIQTLTKDAGTLEERLNTLDQLKKEKIADLEKQVKSLKKSLIKKRRRSEVEDAERDDKKQKYECKIEGIQQPYQSQDYSKPFLVNRDAGPSQPPSPSFDLPNTSTIADTSSNLPDVTSPQADPEPISLLEGVIQDTLILPGCESTIITCTPPSPPCRERERKISGPSRRKATTPKKVSVIDTVEQLAEDINRRNSDAALDTLETMEPWLESFISSISSNTADFSNLVGLQPSDSFDTHSPQTVEGAHSLLSLNTSSEPEKPDSIIHIQNSKKIKKKPLTHILPKPTNDIILVAPCELAPVPSNPKAVQVISDPHQNTILIKPFIPPTERILFSEPNLLNIMPTGTKSKRKSSRSKPISCYTDTIQLVEMPALKPVSSTLKSTSSANTSATKKISWDAQIRQSLSNSDLGKVKPDPVVKNKPKPKKQRIKNKEVKNKEVKGKNGIPAETTFQDVDETTQTLAENLESSFEVDKSKSLNSTSNLLCKEETTKLKVRGRKTKNSVPESKKFKTPEFVDASNSMDSSSEKLLEESLDGNVTANLEEKSIKVQDLDIDETTQTLADNLEAIFEVDKSKSLNSSNSPQKERTTRHNLRSKKKQNSLDSKKIKTPEFVDASNSKDSSSEKPVEECHDENITAKKSIEVLEEGKSSLSFDSEDIIAELSHISSEVAEDSEVLDTSNMTETKDENNELVDEVEKVITYATTTQEDGVISDTLPKIHSPPPADIDLDALRSVVVAQPVNLLSQITPLQSSTPQPSSKIPDTPDSVSSVCSLAITPSPGITLRSRSKQKGIKLFTSPEKDSPDGPVRSKKRPCNLIPPSELQFVPISPKSHTVTPITPRPLSRMQHFIDENANSSFDIEESSRPTPIPAKTGKYNGYGSHGNSSDCCENSNCCDEVKCLPPLGGPYKFSAEPFNVDSPRNYYDASDKSESSVINVSGLFPLGDGVINKMRGKETMMNFQNYRSFLEPASDNESESEEGEDEEEEKRELIRKLPPPAVDNQCLSNSSEEEGEEEERRKLIDLSQGHKGPCIHKGSLSESDTEDITAGTHTESVLTDRDSGEVLIEGVNPVNQVIIGEDIKPVTNKEKCKSREDGYKLRIASKTSDRPKRGHVGEISEQVKGDKMEEHQCPPVEDSCDAWYDGVRNKLAGHECSKCKKFFPSLAVLTVHMKNGKCKEIICKECGRRCSSLSGLTLHQKTHKAVVTSVDKGGEIQCPICFEVLKKKGNLKHHMDSITCKNTIKRKTQQTVKKNVNNKAPPPPKNKEAPPKSKKCTKVVPVKKPKIKISAKPSAKKTASKPAVQISPNSAFTDEIKSKGIDVDISVQSLENDVDISVQSLENDVDISVQSLENDVDISVQSEENVFDYVSEQHLRVPCGSEGPLENNVQLLGGPLNNDAEVSAGPLKNYVEVSSRPAQSCSTDVPEPGVFFDVSSSPCRNNEENALNKSNMCSRTTTTTTMCNLRNKSDLKSVLRLKSAPSLKSTPIDDAEDAEKAAKEKERIKRRKARKIKNLRLLKKKTKKEIGDIDIDKFLGSLTYNE